MEKIIVMGVKWFEGEIDGKKMNTGTVFVQEKLDDRRGTAKGQATQSYKVGGAATCIQLAKRDFPLACMAEFERVTNGREAETIIVDIRPADEKLPTPKAA